MAANANQLTDDQLRAMLSKRNVPVGLIDGSTRQRYRNRLQKLLDSEFKKPHAVPQQANASPAASSRPSTRRRSSGRAATPVATPAAASAQQKRPGYRTPPAAQGPVASFSSDEADLSQAEDRPGTAGASSRQRRRHTPAVPRTSAVPTPTPASTTSRRAAAAAAAPPTPTAQRRSRGRKSAALNTSTSLLLQDDSESDAPDSTAAAAAVSSSSRSVGARRRLDDRLDVSDGEGPPRLSTAPVGNGRRVDTFPSTGGPVSNYWAMVPNFMLLGTLVLVIIIGGYFITEQNRLTKARQLGELQRIVCATKAITQGKDKSVCIETQTGLMQAIKLARPLHDQLARMRGDFECHSGTDNYRLPRSSIAELLVNSVSGLLVNDTDVDNLIALAIRAPRLGILALKSADSNDDNVAHQVNECGHLAAAEGRRSISCRVRLLGWSVLASVGRLATALIYVAIGLACLAGLVCLAVYTVRHGRRREAAMVDATDQVLLHLLTADAGVPVDEVRAELQRSCVLDSVSWDRLRDRIVAREPRIIVEESIRGGEVWRLRPGEAEALRARGIGGTSTTGGIGANFASGGSAGVARGWQGSVLADSGRSMPHIEPPTQCLKLRGMWSPDNGQCDRARLAAELERKAPQDSIVHADCLAMCGEGFVYALFRSRKDAGITRNAVHAHFFDGTLVTARYMTLDKYCQRFPDKADELKTLLGVSN